MCKGSWDIKHKKMFGSSENKTGHGKKLMFRLSLYKMIEYYHRIYSRGCCDSNSIL